MKKNWKECYKQRYKQRIDRMETWLELNKKLSVPPILIATEARLISEAYYGGFWRMIVGLVVERIKRKILFIKFSLWKPNFLKEKKNGGEMVC